MLAGVVLNSTPTTIFTVPDGLLPRLAINICNTSSSNVNVVIEVSKDNNTWYTIMDTTVNSKTSIQLTYIYVTHRTIIRGVASVPGVVHVVVLGA